MAETVPYRGERRSPGPDSPPSAGDSSRVTAFDQTLPSGNELDTSNLGEGDKIGRYEVIERVGAGGMGVVYKAYDPELHREVALKLLKSSRKSGQAELKRRKRLLREARAMAQLSHPNVIPVYDVGEHGEGLYVAMEYVLGANARQWLKKEKPPWRRTLGVFRAAGRGLAAAHTAGLVHRDFKPANVLVGDDGRVRVLDFGLARAVVDEPEPEPEPKPAPGLRDEPELEGHWSETLTADGTILGTPIYMAPEQYAGKPADARTDQYSYCLALYEALYGMLPFGEGSVKDQARAKYRGEIREPPSGSPVPYRLFHVLRKGMSPRPEDRFGSMPDLLRELRTLHEDAQSEVSPWRSWSVVGAVVGLTVGLVAVAELSRSEAIVPPTPTVCPTAAEALADTWNDAHRDRLREAFVASEVAGAEDRFGEVAARLDAQATAWTALYEQTCAEPPHGNRQARLHRARLACLERHRVELGSFVEALDAPSAVVIHRAASSVHGLSPLEDCEDEKSLLAASDRDAGREQRAVELERRIARAKALRTTGRPQEARTEIDEVVDRAGVEDLRPVSGRALLERAYLHRSTGDLAAAELDLRAAYFNAVADRRARVAATAAIGLVDVLAALGRTDDALAWSEHARAHIDALDPAQSLDAALRQALALVGAAASKGPPTPAPTEPSR
ncbi:serine/threonine-protein kinase [Paraliomyxa miuraensis]|uniref:serine/threonine-protein kinase n=1 Tax=Paraliomyxa miuraensis TaxID=376150 RepID=UPI00225A9B90|nr:serine/threonine-protein kinase [Paraliomyxa miuraensis]MCX4246820.1 serine/threonine protein kinase [Paraliomyxa miuraensis]